MIAYVIETPLHDADGVRRGTARHYVLERQRAIDEAALVPGRTWRELVDDEIPEVARARFEAATERGVT